MKRQFRNGELDRLVSEIVNAASADDSVVDEVVNSRATWWAVRREIVSAPQRAPWPPVPKVLRWLMIGTPVAAAIVLGVTLLLRAPVSELDIAQNPSQTVNTRTDSVTDAEPATRVAAPEMLKSTTAGQRREVKNAKIKNERSRQVATRLKRAKPDEIATEFIALSYAPRPESGQVVRVRVPRSMMVSVGLVATVERPTAMVNADLLVGDDGQTHSIRFIK